MRPCSLGGRLPLLDPAKLSETQRKVYDRTVATMVPWADAAHFQSRTADGRLIGPFNPVLFAPEMSSCFADLQAAEARYTPLSERVRQVVILAVGAVWKADYELYAHSAVALEAGLSEAAIRSLADGGS
jgi:4-carboxymuconolactone decarboxylase